MKTMSKKTKTYLFKINHLNKYKIKSLANPQYLDKNNLLQNNTKK